MPRSATPAPSRAASVRQAADSLPAAIALAVRESETHGYDSQEARAAWESVEHYGATVHRQSRLLAGKSRGG
jgi:hypothetical protein